MPSDPDALRAEAQKMFKASTTSRFHGVALSRRDNTWMAYISHEGRRDIDAAREYDKAARRMHKSAAKLNFDPETDEELLGRRLIPV